MLFSYSFPSSKKATEIPSSLFQCFLSFLSFLTNSISTVTTGGVLCFKDVSLVWTSEWQKRRELFNPLNNFYCTENCKEERAKLSTARQAL